MGKSERLTPSEQNRIIDEWLARRPSRPTVSRPTLREGMNTDEIFMITIPLGTFSIVLFPLLMLHVTVRPVVGPGSSVVAWSMTWGLLIFGIVTLIVGFASSWLIETIPIVKYERKMRSTGWAAYENSIVGWQRVGNSLYDQLPDDQYDARQRVLTELQKGK